MFFETEQALAMQGLAAATQNQTNVDAAIADALSKSAPVTYPDWFNRFNRNLVSVTTGQPINYGSIPTVVNRAFTNLSNTAGTVVHNLPPPPPQPGLMENLLAMSASISNVFGETARRKEAVKLIKKGGYVNPSQGQNFDPNYPEMYEEPTPPWVPVLAVGALVVGGIWLFKRKRGGR